MELVKEEVHRALQAFSTRPIKGEPHPPLPSDLLKPFDVSKDGQVTYPEFKAGLRGLGLGLTADEAEELARDVDGEGTGLVDKQRFETVAVEDWGRDRRRSLTTAVTAAMAAAARQRHSSKDLSLDEGTRNGNSDGGASRCVVAQQRAQQRTGDEEAGDDDGGMRGGVDHAAVDGGWNVDTSFRSMTADEARHGTPRRDDDDTYADDHVSCDKDGNGYALKKPLSPRELPPPPPPVGATNSPQGPSSRKNSSGQPRSSPTVSFDCWRRMTDSREGGGDGARGRGARASTTCGNTHDETRTKGRRHSPQKRQKHALDTLRSLLQRDGFDHPGDHDDVRHPCRGSPTTISNSGRDDRACSGMDHVQERGEEYHREAAGSIGSGSRSGSGGAVPGEERGRAVNRGRGPRRAEQRRARPSSAPAGSRAHGEGKRERREAATARAHNKSGDIILSSRQDVENARRNAARAESILRLRSRGDLVGLRKSLSRADPTASGVVSRREMERVILRRFGTGLGDDETKELAARYRKDFNGRAMVDYGRLVDTLEAVEAGLLGRAMRGVGDSSSERWPRQAEHKRHQSGSSSAQQTSSPGGVASGRGRTSCQRHGKGYEGGDGGGSGGGGYVVRVPAEEGQLVRRSRSKTLALLYQHGTRRADCIFRLVDPGQCGALSIVPHLPELRFVCGMILLFLLGWCL